MLNCDMKFLKNDSYHALSSADNTMADFVSIEISRSILTDN